LSVVVAPIVGLAATIRRVTDWDGVEYRKVKTLQQWLADRALSGLDLHAVGSLLDIGCGGGRITAEIAARIRKATVVGLDPSPHMIAIAPTHGSLSFELGDVCLMIWQCANRTIPQPGRPSSPG
jgi:trans-aconitate 2-methyltransferase